MTRTIIFIGHAEKSKHDVVHLDAQGKARAIFLADYILHPYNDFEVPTAIYTMTAPHSKRCIETMAPTLAKINAVHHINVPRAQSEQLAKTLLMSCEKESSRDQITCIINPKALACNPGAKNSGSLPIFKTGLGRVIARTARDLANKIPFCQERR